MTQEDKQLLIKDLCARLPYRVKVLGPWEKDGQCVLSEVDLTSNRQIRIFEDWFNIEDVRPYLRPLSSMTGEEYLKYCETRDWRYVDDDHYEYFDTLETFDWLNAHHFDYRLLIERGLALEAPEDMYKSE